MNPACIQQGCAALVTLPTPKVNGPKTHTMLGAGGQKGSGLLAILSAKPVGVSKGSVWGHWGWKRPPPKFSACVGCHPGWQSKLPQMSGAWVVTPHLPVLSAHKAGALALAWKSALIHDPQTLAQSPKHTGHQEVTKIVSSTRRKAQEHQFKVTWTILDRAELVLGFSVQTGWEVCRDDLQGWRGPWAPGLGTGLGGQPPLASNQGFPALLLSLWGPEIQSIWPIHLHLAHQKAVL